MEQKTFQKPTQALDLYRVNSFDNIVTSLQTLFGFCAEKIENNQTEPFGPLLELADRILVISKEPGVSEIDRKINKQLFQLVDVDLIASFIDNPEEEAIANELEVELGLIASALGLLEGQDVYPEVVMYEILSFRNSDAKIDIPTYINSLREYVDGGDRLEVIQAAIAHLGLVYENEDFYQGATWLDALIITLLLDIVWTGYGSLSPEGKKILLTNYLHTSVVLGVPIEYLLDQFFVNQTRTIIDMGVEAALLSRAVKENTEQIVVNTTTGDQKALSVIFKEIDQLAEKSDDSGFAVQKYIKNIYAGQEYGDEHTSWMRQLLHVYARIQNGGFIQENYLLEEEKERLKDKEELTQVIQWSLKKKNFGKFVSYYKQKDPRVPLSAYLFRVSVNEDLSKQDIQDHYLALSQALQEGGVLQEGVDLIEYHEDDDAFHWNEDLLV
jgi:hypothetical protein